jgi:hypothetical protein
VTFRPQLIFSLPTRDTTYYELKHAPDLVYRYLKTLLRGHLRSPSLLPHFEKCGELQSTGSSEDDLTAIPPFRGWIVSGERWESFTIDGRLHLDLSDSSFDSDLMPISPGGATHTEVISSIFSKHGPTAAIPTQPTTPDAMKAEQSDIPKTPGSPPHGWSCRVG